MILAILQGFAMVQDYQFTPPVAQGTTYRIVDATGQQVGSIVETAACGIVVYQGTPTWDCPSPPTDFVWSPATLDQDANGFINGSDIDWYAWRFAAGTMAADFDCNGWVNGDDDFAFHAAMNGGVP